VKEHPNSPYLEEFRARPATERRAASIHMHVDGDKGPSMAEVTNASLQTLYSLLEHSNGAQLGQIMKAALDSLEVLKAWDKLEHCCWFAQKASEWSQYQYRYAVPTWLVERLLESQDVPTTTSLHNALAAMVTTVFNSPTPLVNLSTSDIISNLITLIIRRVSLDPGDPLLPTLVECIASLGSHVYYSDQIQDLAGDLINRLVVVEVQGIPRAKGDSEKARSQAIRCLLASLLELMNAATKDQDQDERRDQSKQVGASTSFASSADAPPNVRASRRSRVSPDTWQDTLSLLCDRNYAVRADYSEALVSYLQKEIRKRGDTTDEDGVKRVRPLVDGPIRQANNINLVMYGDSATRFLNAIQAYVFILATSTSTSPSASPTPTGISSGDILPAVNVVPATPVSSGPAVEAVEIQEQSQVQDRRSLTLTPRARKASVVQSLLDRVPAQVSPSAFASASDYAHILAVLTAAHEQLPIRGLLTGVPMLLALDGATKFNDVPDCGTSQRWKAIKEVIARTWSLIAKVWDSTELAGVAQKVLFVVEFHTLI
jgi:protein EFR3